MLTRAFFICRDFVIYSILMVNLVFRWHNMKILIPLLQLSMLVNVNHMRERHLDGAVLIRQAAYLRASCTTRSSHCWCSRVMLTAAHPVDVKTMTQPSLVNYYYISIDPHLNDATLQIQSGRLSLLDPRLWLKHSCFELLVLLDQHWNYSTTICLLSRTGREMLIFVRSMME